MLWIKLNENALLRGRVGIGAGDVLSGRLLVCRRVPVGLGVRVVSPDAALCKVVDRSEGRRDDDLGDASLLSLSEDVKRPFNCGV